MLIVAQVLSFYKVLFSEFRNKIANVTAAVKVTSGVLSTFNQREIDRSVCVVQLYY